MELVSKDIDNVISKKYYSRKRKVSQLRKYISGEKYII
jgi:hypothetical protein